MIRNTPRKPVPDIVMMNTLARKVVWHLQRATVLLKPCVLHRLRDARESALRQQKNNNV
jgi:hypothetical protein